MSLSKKAWLLLKQKQKKYAYVCFTAEARPLVLRNDNEAPLAPAPGAPRWLGL